MSQIFTLDAESLFDKFGFGDGDMLSDLLFDNDIDYELGEKWNTEGLVRVVWSLEDRLLLKLVETYLLPALPLKLEPRLICTHHNPVRCDGWGHGRLAAPESCRDIAVDVPEADVLAMARELEQTIKAELAQDGAP